MKLGFYSCMTGMPWGGSEELWMRSAVSLLNRGHQVCVNYRHWPREVHQLERLKSLGANIHLREFPHREIKNWWGRTQRIPLDSVADARSWLTKHRPDYVLITLGYHVDRLEVADACYELGIPYAINVQCASDQNFVNERLVDRFRDWYQRADQVLVVSRENQLKVETNIGAVLTNVHQIDNPSKIQFDAEIPWPDTDQLRLACVGRIHLQSKGQDLIVRALSHPRWQTRDWEVRFYGSNQGNLKQLEALIESSGVAERFIIEGYSPVEEIWAENQALILASRYEGAALVVVEAMRAGRPVVATDTGRNRELVDEGKTGFIAPAATIELVDQALELAYQNRQRLKEMGQQAQKDIRLRYPERPEVDLADRLIERSQQADSLTESAASQENTPNVG